MAEKGEKASSPQKSFRWRQCITRNAAVVETADRTALSEIAVGSMAIADVEILNMEIWDGEFGGSGSVYGVESCTLVGGARGQRHLSCRAKN